MADIGFPHAIQVAQRFAWEMVLTDKWDHIFAKWDYICRGRRPRTMLQDFTTSRIYWGDASNEVVNVSLYSHELREKVRLLMPHAKFKYVLLLQDQERQINVRVFGSGNVWLLLDFTLFIPVGKYGDDSYLVMPPIALI